MKVKSPSKLNLHLEVIRKRDDGYHDLRSAIQLIDFHDVMEFKIRKKDIVLNDQLEINDNTENQTVMLRVEHSIRETRSIWVS